MAKVDDGGPAVRINRRSRSPEAFPSHGIMGEVTHEGMTIRDWFAGHILPTFATSKFSERQLSEWFGKRTDVSQPEAAAKAAYAMADAMLAERKKPGAP